MPTDNECIRHVRNWLESFVIELNLCPFAKRELVQDRVRFTVCDTTYPTELLHRLHAELNHLHDDDNIATTLLIHPNTLTDFDEYNQFLSLVDTLLDEMDFVGEFQVASFHPDYRFAGTNNDDAENYTNRTPYPMLHILREADLEQAIRSYPDADQIPARNIELMNQLGVQALRLMHQNLTH